jgi:hypothetical protein
MNNQQLEEIKTALGKLQSDFQQLSQSFYKNNFSSNQTFTKDIVFESRMRAPVFSSAPAVGAIGDLIVVGGKLYVCTTAGDVVTPALFTLCGSQS